MKILLDECVTKKLKKAFTGHNVLCVSDLGWNGLRNGNLMSKCVDHSFDVLITIDKNMTFQQHISSYNLTVVVFDSPTSKREDLEKYIPVFISKTQILQKGQFYILTL